MSDGNGHRDGRDLEALDSYVDGAMTDAARAAFTTRLATNRTLRREVELQQRIDGSLGRLFEAPSEERVRRIVECVMNAPARAPDRGATYRRWGRGLAIAAAIGVAGVGVWRIADFYATSPETTAAGGAIPSWVPKVSPLDAYRQAKADHFKPGWVCKDDQEFMDTFAKRYRQPLLLGQAPPGVVAIGLKYANVITESSLILLNKVDDSGVLVFIDKAAYDRGLSVPDDSGMHLFRRVLGNAVLYELTPLEEPRLLDLFYDPTGGTGTG